MRTALMTLALVGFASLAPAQNSAQLARCLHGRSESADQKARREKAVRAAQAINTAEVVAVGPQRPRYRRPEDLRSIPALPDGFALQFNLSADASGYSFSIKDTLDACHYAIFSDQDKLVYDGTPLSTALLIPVGTK